MDGYEDDFEESEYREDFEHETPQTASLELSAYSGRQSKRGDRRGGWTPLEEGGGGGEAADYEDDFEGEVSKDGGSTRLSRSPHREDALPADEGRTSDPSGTPEPRLSCGGEEEEEEEPPSPRRTTHSQLFSANMLTINDLKDIVCELPEGFTTEPEDSPHAAHSLDSEALLQVETSGTSTLKGEALLEDSTTTTSPPPAHMPTPPPSEGDLAFDLDAFVLRFVLNSALVDVPPMAATSQHPQAGGEPVVVRPYWETRQGVVQYPYEPACRTEDRREQEAKGGPEQVGAGGGGGDRPLPVSRTRGSGDDGRSYEDLLRYEAAKVKQRARVLQEEGVGSRDENKPMVGDDERRRRRSRMGPDPQETEDSTLFAEHYARFIHRLSRVSQQELEEDLMDLQGPQGEAGRGKELSMAACLGESLREVFTDPVVMGLVKESALSRLKSRRRRQGQKAEQVAN